MSDIAVEGGPLDGQRLPDYGGQIVRVPQPIPWNVRLLRDPGLAYEVLEYERRGKVYRWPGLIGDARAEMDISEEAFRDPKVRREARWMLRREIERLDPAKEIDRIVWVVAHDPFRFMFRLVAFVGGRRSEHAAFRRAELRGRDAALGWAG